jgi:hypothetical protein
MINTTQRGGGGATAAATANFIQAEFESIIDNLNKKEIS